jgi:hypothetical protein
MFTDITNYVYLVVIVLRLVQIYLRRIPALVTYRDHWYSTNRRVSIHVKDAFPHSEPTVSVART